MAFNTQIKTDLRTIYLFLMKDKYQLHTIDFLIAYIIISQFIFTPTLLLC